MATYAFFLNSFNDVDNMTPVIWKFLEKGESTIVIFGTDFDYKNDYRINFLQEKYDLEVFDFPSEYKNSIQRKMKYILGSYKPYEVFLKEHDVSVCIFEWVVYYGSSIQNMFFGAAKRLQIPVISIPHGVNIFINLDPMELQREIYDKTGKLPKTNISHNIDMFVDPNYVTQRAHISEGIDPNTSEIWGSARYYPNWAKTNLEICPKFASSKSSEGKIKVVFMLPHWAHNVDVYESVNLIKKLANLPWVYTIIKDHTRSNGGLNNEFRKELNSLPNVEASVSAHSPSLIQWSDVVINFGSSIGIEAILQDKILINPSYLHTNQTFFEDTDSAYEPENIEELIGILDKVRNNDLIPISETNKRKLLEVAVYGDKNEFDILEYYYERISNLKTAGYKLKPAPNHIINVIQTIKHRINSKLQVPKVLIRDNPIKPLKRVYWWILRTYFNIYRNEYDRIRFT